MHRGRTLLLAALLASLVAPSSPRAQAPGARKVRVAVLEIRPLATEASKAELLSEVGLTEAASMPGFEVIGRSDINSLIGFEKQKQVMGCSDDSTCLAEIGGALGVDLILVGSLGKIGSLYRIDLKLVETKRARVRSRVGVTVEGSEDKLVAAIQKAVRDLLAPETPESAKVAASAETRKSLEVRPQDVPAVTVNAAAPQAAPGGAAAARTSARRKWAYVAGGAGIALLAGGAMAGVSARSAYDDEKTAAAAGDLAAYEDGKSKAKSMSLVADGLLLGGAAGVGIGTWLFLTSGAPAGLALEIAPTHGGAYAALAGGF